MNQLLTGIKRRSFNIKLRRSGFGGLGKPQQYTHHLGVAGEDQERQHYTLLREHRADTPAPNPIQFLVGVGIDPGMCHTLDITLGLRGFDQLSEGNRCRNKGEQKGCSRHHSRFRATKYHYRKIYGSTIFENSDRVVNLNRMRPFFNLRFRHNTEPTGRQTYLLVHGSCVH